MTDDRLELSRRKILASAGAIGLAGAGAGLGTSAYFSDQETFTNNQLVAGELDLKVAISQHYVDWLPDTDTSGVSKPADPIPAPQETDDAEMADSKSDADIVLPANVPGATNPTDTTSDDILLELVEDDGDNGDDIDIDGDGNVETDGTDDDEPALEFAVGSKVNDINGGVPPSSRSSSLCNLTNSDQFDDEDAQRPIIDLEDVKPGDFGFIRLEFVSCDNPAFIQFEGNIVDRAENGYTEPEREDPDESGDADGDGEDDRVELIDEVRIALVQGDVYQLLSGGSTVNPKGESPSKFLTTLRALDNGVAVDPLGADPPAEDPGTEDPEGRCFQGDRNYRFTLIWWLPVNHANEIQGDSVTFDIGLYAEQCRHNEGFGNDNDLKE